jgi:arabinogalactan oligomer/maltooligosaccharide transport system substrate-binding protein
MGRPWAAETVALIYNKSLVDEPPETLEDMKAIMEEHHDPDGGMFGLGYPINPYYVSAFAQAYGEEIYNGEENSLGITSDEVKKGLRVLLDDLRPYMPDDPGGGIQKSIFTNGNAPFTIDGPWQLPALKDADFEVGVTTLPDLPDGGTPRPYMGIKLLFFGTKMDEEPTNGAAAREFAEWYTTNRRRMLNLANNGGFVPVHADLADDSRLPENVSGYARQVQTGYPMPANSNMNQVWGPFGDAITQAFNGNGDLDDLLATAEENIRHNWGWEDPDDEGLTVTNDEPAQDPDGDDLYEDIDGDGETTVFDAISYFEHRDSNTIQNNPDAFDFDGDGESGTVFDALELYNELS